MSAFLADLSTMLPAWLPSWSLLLLALPVLLYALVFLGMPFSVFGVKGRLESLEARVEALTDEIRVMNMRKVGVIPEELPEFGRMKAAVAATAAPPPTPPRAAPPLREPAARRPAPSAPPLRAEADARASGRRLEPRLD
jgi:hypothetical protein